MATGAVFTIIANDGKTDRLLTAQAILNARIRKISCDRARAGRDPTPSINEIEQTHILFFVAHSKPFAVIAFEYGKVKVSSGNISWGSTGVTYSIPVFGDFFIDMVVNLKLEATSATAGTVPPFPAFIGPDDQVLTTTSSTSARENTVSGVYTEYTYEYVGFNGNVRAFGSAATNFVRYAEFPGERVFKNVRWDVNNSPLDSYNSNTAAFHRKFKILPHKLNGYKRLVGQEVPVSGVTGLSSIAGSSNFTSGVDLLDITGASARGAPVSASTTCRKVVQVVNGPQTPKITQPMQSWWIKLLFWFCDDPRLAFPSIAVPYGQRFITVDLEEQENILFVAPGNLFTKLTISEQTSSGLNAGTATALAVTSEKKTVTLTPTLARGSTINSSQKILDMVLMVNNLFVSNEIHDIFIKSIGFNLVRIHLSQSNMLTTNSDSIRLQKLKYPIESFYVGMRPRWNVDKANPDQYKEWHMFTSVQDNVISTTAQSSVDIMIDNTVPFSANSNMHKRAITQFASESITFPTYVPTIDTLSVVAHGTPLYKPYDTAFYHDYLTYTFGASTLVTPDDPGACLITFCLYPGIYQPSGYLNFSRSRETDLDFTSSYITANTPADLIIEATGINFLVIADGSASLRYTT